MENQGIIKDGIINLNPDVYNNGTNPKILWVLKQAYEDEAGKDYSLIKFLNERINDLKSDKTIDEKIASLESFGTSWKTFYPIALTTSLVLKLNLNYDWQYKYFLSLEYIALINLIKEVGKIKMTSDSVLNNTNKDEIVKQINDINPNIIIFGVGTRNKCLVKEIISKLKNLNKDNISFEDGNYWSFFKTDNMLFILMDHPSSFCNSRDEKGDTISLPAAVDDIVKIIKDKFPDSKIPCSNNH